VKLIWSVGGLVLLFGAGLLADENMDRMKLLGSWEMTAHNDGETTSWMFTAKGDTFEVKEQEGKETIAAFECSIKGKPCEVKVNGKKTSVSLWYNGSYLVEMESQGSDVLKRRFRIGSDPDSMEVETIPVVPAGKNETFQYKRVSLSATNK